MFQKRKKIYRELLDAIPEAAQIRSFDNHILASNSAGLELFGDLENPFSFLNHTNQKQDVKKLETALWQHSLLDFYIAQDDILWHIHLSPIKNAMLIRASSQPKNTDLDQAMEAQIKLFQDMIQGLDIPIYLVDIAGEIIYVKNYSLFACCFRKSS